MIDSDVRFLKSHTHTSKFTAQLNCIMGLHLRPMLILGRMDSYRLVGIFYSLGQPHRRWTLISNVNPKPITAMLKPASNNIENRHQMTKSPKSYLIFKIFNSILIKFMQKLQFLSVLRNLWWYSWDVCAKPTTCILKIEFEYTDIESNLKSWHHAALFVILLNTSLHVQW